MQARGRQCRGWDRLTGAGEASSSASSSGESLRPGDRMCLAVGNAAMYDLELPARKHGDARRSAMYLVACLQDTDPGR